MPLVKFVILNSPVIVLKLNGLSVEDISLPNESNRLCDTIEQPFLVFQIELTVNDEALKPEYGVFNDGRMYMSFPRLIEGWQLS